MVILSLSVAGAHTVRAQSVGPAAQTRPAEVSPAEMLTARQWSRLDRSVQQALRWMASRQSPDGSFPTRPNGQPAVTAICVMAFMSAGHLPGKGEYGPALDRAIQYMLAAQKPDGLLARAAPTASSDLNNLLTAQAAAYNHAITGLALSELYGMSPDQNRRIKPVLDAALAYALRRQPFPKRQAGDNGGWRYVRRHQSSDSDLSVTSWYLMFLRSCKNAGFDVPSQTIDEGSAYVMRCFEPTTGYFWYALHGREHVTTRGMTGAGILSLSLAGRHQTPQARQAGEWLLQHPYDHYRATRLHDRFFYGAFYSSNAMFQLGGRYWGEFYPVLLRTLTDNQKPDGSWDPERTSDAEYGNVYSSALAVLALTPPYQLLPIFQR
ncbi:MAG: terpene cyclase/mutase family protein [Planctomycetes bacterium]|nr:terpene cyclase/mutase family protein [Planctomycetota bacterium]